VTNSKGLAAICHHLLVTRRTAQAGVQDAELQHICIRWRSVARMRQRLGALCEITAAKRRAAQLEIGWSAWHWAVHMCRRQALICNLVLATRHTLTEDSSALEVRLVWLGWRNVAHTRRCLGAVCKVLLTKCHSALGAKTSAELKLLWCHWRHAFQTSAALREERRRTQRVQMYLKRTRCIV